MANSQSSGRLSSLLFIVLLLLLAVAAALLFLQSRTGGGTSVAGDVAMAQSIALRARDAIGGNA
jgi:hypothetical protein